MDMLNINGNVENICRPYDFERLVDKYMGEEAAKYFRLYQEKADEEVRYATEEESAELSIYKENVKDMREAFTNIAIAAKELMDILSSGQIGKNHLFFKVSLIMNSSVAWADKVKVFGPAF